MKRFNFWVPLTLFTLSCLFAMYAVFFEKSFLGYPVQPFPIVEKITKPGKPILMLVTRCNDSDSEKTYKITHVIRNIETEKTYLLPDRDVPIHPGCVTETSLIHIAPESLEDGLYQVFGESHTKGIIRTFHVKYWSGIFQVKK